MAVFRARELRETLLLAAELARVDSCELRYFAGFTRATRPTWLTLACLTVPTRGTWTRMDFRFDARLLAFTGDPPSREVAPGVPCGWGA